MAKHFKIYEVQWHHFPKAVPSNKVQKNLSNNFLNSKGTKSDMFNYQASKGQQFNYTFKLKPSSLWVDTMT